VNDPQKSQLAVAVEGAYVDQLVLQDFRNFVYVLWQHLQLPEPTVVQYDIAHYLQHGPERRIIEAFRGVGKSWLTAAYVLWRLLRNPEERVLVVSASKDRADAFTTFVRRLIEEVPILSHLKPRKDQRDSNLAFDVGPSSAHQAPSVRSVGITGQLTGGRATIIVADDVETPKNSLTALMRDRLAELVKEFDAVLVPGGEIVYLGTPQTEMSLYNELPKRGYCVRIWPARYPDAKRRKFYDQHLAPLIVEALTKNPKLAEECAGRGAPTDPARFTDLDLVKREASYGRSGFALQFMLDTSLSDQDRHPLRLADLMVMGLTTETAPVKVAWGSGPDQIVEQLPCPGLRGDRWHRPAFIHADYIEFQGSVLTIDPSGRGKDETGYAVVKMLNGYLYVLACGGLKGGYDDTVLEFLANLAKEHKVNQVLIESNFGDGMFTKLIEPFFTRIHPVTVEEIHHTGQKELRIIDVLEPVFNQHRVVFSEKVVLEDVKADDVNYSLLYQITRITKDKQALAHEDRLEALAMAMGYWVEQLAKDVKAVEDQHRADKIDAALERFENSVFGRSQRSDSWSGLDRIFG
jgi:hypothetical protein